MNLHYDDAAALNPLPAVWIHDLNDKSKNYDNTQKVSLIKGENKITANKIGIVYIAVTNLPISKEVAVALASVGREMPRFILGEHIHADWGKCAMHTRMLPMLSW